MVQFDFRDPVTHRTDGVRFRSGEAFSSSGTRDAATVAEWQPHISGGQQQIFGGISVLITPELMVQYDHLAHAPNTYEIFRRHPDALRIGPQLTLNFADNPYLLPAQPSWLSNLSFSLTGHISGDALGNRGYAFGQAALSYQLSPNIGISTSYGYGNSDATGNSQSQFKVGLTVKLG